MSRLTEKVKNTDDYIKLATKDKQEFINKLGKLEDLEEQLGCPLEVLKPNQKVEFIKDNETLCADVMGVNIQTKKIMIGSAWSFKELPLNQFGKTWWLRKDKSE